MKLFNVTLCNDNNYKNDWAITKDSYGNDILLNESTAQKIRIGKYLIPKLTYLGSIESINPLGKDTASAYEFSNDGHFVLNMKNLSITMIKNNKGEENKFTHLDLMYVSIPIDEMKIIDQVINTPYAKVINTYKNNNMLGAIIKIDSTKFPPKVIGETTSKYALYRNEEVEICKFVLYNDKANNSTERVVIKTITINRDYNKNLGIHISTEYSNNEAYQDALDTMLDSNFFKKPMITPSKEIKTSVYLVNEHKMEEFKSSVYENIKDDIKVLGVNPSVFKKDPKSDEYTYFDQTLKDHIVNAKVRAVTVVGLKIPKELFVKYKIQTCFMHDLTTGIISCIKA